MYNDPEKLEPYSHDEVADAEYAHMPEAVVRPESAEEIAAIMKLANRETDSRHAARRRQRALRRRRADPSAASSCSVDRMNRILEIDAANLMVVVEPGVVTNEINEAVEPTTGLFYAGYPMSLETCYIGGNVAENAGGGKAVKYGVTGRYVIGLEVVTPTGEIVQLGGKRVKDVTGYDLISLMVGSEGTLGIFTKIIAQAAAAAQGAGGPAVLFETAEDGHRRGAEDHDRRRHHPHGHRVHGPLSVRPPASTSTRRCPTSRPARCC